MFALFCVFFLVAIIAFIVRNAVKNDEEVRFGATLVGTIAGILAIIFIVLSSLIIIPAGYTGVPVVLGKVNPTELNSGLQFKNPLASVKKLSIRTDTYTMSGIATEGDVAAEDAVVALSSDGMQLPLEVTFAYQLITGDASAVYQHLGTDYVSRILRPAARASVRGAVSHFTAQEAYSTHREELQQKMRDRMEDEISKILSNTIGFSGQGFSVSSVLLRNVEIPDRVKNAIEAKLQAQQEAEQMQFVLQKETQEAERKRVEAQGIADFQSIVTKGITPSLLTWKGIEATEKLAASNNAKVIVIGSGKDGLPIILGGNN